MLEALIGLLLFVLGVWAIAMIIQSQAETLHKVLWILLVLFFPFIGFLIWYFKGPKPS